MKRKFDGAVEIPSFEGMKKLEVDFGNPEATIAELIDLAHRIGQGQKPGSGPALMCNFLRDVTPGWVNLVTSSVKNEYSPVDTTIAISRTCALLLAMTILHSAKGDRMKEAVSSILECITEDIKELVSKGAKVMQEDEMEIKIQDTNIEMLAGLLAGMKN